jgi:hypothetical protein
MLVKITPEMFQNNNFVNKDGQKISNIFSEIFCTIQKTNWKPDEHYT